ncbi:uncharacterized protein LOC122092482 [Macadamia integrifolia]|uniref:uncharacterized protein LOC122092482 n=3 Tax=Macadamia integrifolia TaxID=60698 RepID=UPI001C52DE84|nr:uncharacterized protein LOC122092482 [Macadamia integrifolia]
MSSTDPAMARCDYCNQLCDKYTTKNGPNRGRTFFKCPRHNEYFMWVDEFRLCDCGEGQCKVRVAKTATNLGRRFWCCPKSNGPLDRGCKFFRWIYGDINLTSAQSSDCGTSNSMVGAQPSPSAPSSDFVKGYLERAIKGEEEKSRVLKNEMDVSEEKRRIYTDILEAINNIDINKGGS